jgi:hypothetical protein
MHHPGENTPRECEGVSALILQNEISLLVRLRQQAWRDTLHRRFNNTTRRIALDEAAFYL